ncbi:MAG: phenylalanine--tRNA ligase subunit beta [Ignavibacteria bacterium]|nr:phenylalanine--tRNA ligase subunit beta [Bacteroidota bacterium]MSQ45463.1 phenylalanine--tRNA ligase subunit beta [Ignavibacteria bacterium]
MKISLNWLQDYISLSESPEKIASTLTSLGLEVENIEYQSAKYEKIITGKVLSVSDHPNATKLKVCQVEIGKKENKLNIVCGDLNVSAGQKVVVALEGSIIPHNQHDPNGKPFKLVKTNLRGITSEGMLCSEYELDLSENKESICILPTDAKVGIKFSSYLNYNDVIFDVALTPNRGDCLSHFGIARELGAKLNKKISLPQNSLKEVLSNKKHNLSIDIISKNTSLYLGRIISGLKVKESPNWLKKRLASIGVRSINNIVDATNYVMFEVGQPLHAFDFDKIKGKKIIVKDSVKNAKFKTLDRKTHKLNESTIMICDSSQAIGIGGIMGGENSEISNETTTIFLEAAIFSSESIRRSSKFLGINSDASTRFERGIDSSKTKWSIDRAAELISQIAGGKVEDKLFQAGKILSSLISITLSLEKLYLYLGYKLNLTFIKKYLNLLEIKVIKSNSGNVVCQIPKHRNDIKQDVDLIEEIARLHGYENIPSSTEVHYHFNKPQNKQEIISDEIKIYLASIGLNEICTNSFIKKTTGEKLDKNIVKLANPISADLEILKPSLLPTMLGTIHFNQNQGSSNLALFEIGTIYKKSNTYKSGKNISEYTERQQLLITLIGKSEIKKWFQRERNYDLFDVKGIIESLCYKFLFEKCNFISFDKTELTLNNLNIHFSSESIGKLGLLHKKYLLDFGIEEEVFYAEIDLEGFVKVAEQCKKQFKPIHRFPGIRRDIALITPKSLLYSYLTEIIEKNKDEKLEHHEIFDLYSSKEIGNNLKSIAISLYYQSSERTLTDEEVDRSVHKIIQKFEINKNIIVRRKLD